MLKVAVSIAAFITRFLLMLKARKTVLGATVTRNTRTLSKFVHNLTQNNNCLVQTLPRTEKMGMHPYNISKEYLFVLLALLRK